VDIQLSSAIHLMKVGDSRIFTGEQQESTGFVGKSIGRERA
jgi:hypothetical protein